MNVFMTMLKNFDGKFGQIEEQLAAINLSRRTRLTRGEQSAALWHHHKPTVQDVAQVTTESTRIESLWLNLSLLMLRLTGLQSSRLHTVHVTDFLFCQLRQLLMMIRMKLMHILFLLYCVIMDLVATTSKHFAGDV